MRFKSFAVVAIFLLAVPGAAFAQDSPSTRVRAMPQRDGDSAFALRAAYREIGRAEQVGATGRYIDAARSRYRSAIDRHARNDDTGAAAEARLATDLARVAIDERPLSAQTGPKDIPAPPTPRPGSGPAVAMDGMPMIEEMWSAMAGDGPPGIRIRHGGFDATQLAEIMKVETSAEARQLAQASVDANTAAQKAALAGNVAEASRQTRISEDLASAVHDLAVLNHPELGHRTMRMRIFGGNETLPM